MANSAMGMLASLARDLQWKIFMRQKLMALMVKLLAFLEFLMVFLHNTFISLALYCIHATYAKRKCQDGGVADVN